jgi:hypothetical protein
MDINDRISQYRQDIKSDRVDMSFGEIINMYKDNEIIISPEYHFTRISACVPLGLTTPNRFR